MKRFVLLLILITTTTTSWSQFREDLSFSSYASYGYSYSNGYYIGIGTAIIQGIGPERPPMSCDFDIPLLLETGFRNSTYEATLSAGFAAYDPHFYLSPEISYTRKNKCLYIRNISFKQNNTKHWYFENKIGIKIYF